MRPASPVVTDESMRAFRKKQQTCRCGTESCGPVGNDASALVNSASMARSGATPGVQMTAEPILREGKKGKPLP